MSQQISVPLYCYKEVYAGVLIILRAGQLRWDQDRLMRGQGKQESEIRWGLDGMDYCMCWMSGTRIIGEKTEQVRVTKSRPCPKVERRAVENTNIAHPKLPHDLSTKRKETEKSLSCAMDLEGPSPLLYTVVRVMAYPSLPYTSCGYSTPFF